MRREPHPVVKELRAVRLARGLSLEQFGDIAGYTGNHIWSIEHGKQSVKIEVLADLAQALDMELVLKERRNG